MRAYGHRFVFDYDFLETINKKVSYSKVQEINISQISENEIRNYLKKKAAKMEIRIKNIYVNKVD